MSGTEEKKRKSERGKRKQERGASYRWKAIGK